MSCVISVLGFLSIGIGVDFSIMSRIVITDHEDSAREPLRWSYIARDEVGDGFGDGFSGTL
jgi:hypothetical protein